LTGRSKRDDTLNVGAPEAGLQNFVHIRNYIRRGRLPWRRLSERRRARLINEDVVSRIAAGESNGKPFPLHDNLFVDGRRFQQAVYSIFEHEIALAAVEGLKTSRPVESAFQLLSPLQNIFFCVAIMSFAWSLWRWPTMSLVAVNIITTAYFLSAIVFRLWLLFLSRGEIINISKPKQLPEDSLPVITILLPLLRDAAALPTLVQAIDNLDYPEAKKDVKLLLEEDDPETLQEVGQLQLEKRYEVIIIPNIGPKTKPKACNFGLYLSRGELIVIYDAEDLPEQDQLRKAAAAFHRADSRLACVQARLNYYNDKDNWLTRLFTLEYSLWFDWLLPALQRMGAPIPLGGTSNFFCTDILDSVGGWDPYNVTEDADLGLRLSRLGYRVEVLDSTTFEEANCQTNNWIRQRSRWMKGYLQTWLVHMRRPHRIIKTTGWKGFVAVQLFVAGNLFSALINPIMWTLFLLWAVIKPPFLETLFPDPLMQINLIALVFGNLFFICMMMAAPLKRRRGDLCLYGLLTPVYWLLTSIAAYKAMFQAITRPHYWEKTDHVISGAAKKKRMEALRKHF